MRVRPMLIYCYGPKVSCKLSFQITLDHIKSGRQELIVYVRTYYFCYDHLFFLIAYYCTLVDISKIINMIAKTSKPPWPE